MQCNKCQEQTERSTGRKTLMTLFVLDIFACIQEYYTAAEPIFGINV